MKALRTVWPDGGGSEVGQKVVARTTEAVGELLQNGMFWRGDLARAVRRRDFKGTAWSLAALSLLLLFYVWQHTQVVKLGYDVEALRKERQDLVNEYYFLKYRLNDVKSLSRVERTAREELGMVTPRTDQVVILDETEPAPSRLVGAWFAFMRRTEGR
jgi:cell division protein FtsL